MQRDRVHRGRAQCFAMQKNACAVWICTVLLWNLYGFAMDLYGFAVRSYGVAVDLLRCCCVGGGGAINCDGITVCGPWLEIALNWPG